MAINFDVTVGGDNSTSYVTLLEYGQYTEQLVTNNDNPTADNTRDNQKLLIAATTVVNNLLYLTQGTPTSTTQRLEWPRIDCTDRRNNTILSTTLPEYLKDAVCAMAVYLRRLDTTPPEQSTLPEENKAPYNNELNIEGIIPVEVKQLITNITGNYPPATPRMLLRG